MKTDSNILFCFGKQKKNISIAWENNYRYIFTCGNKAKDFKQQNILDDETLNKICSFY